MAERIFTPGELKEMLKGAREKEREEAIIAGDFIPDDNGNSERPEDKTDSKKPVIRKSQPPVKKRNAPGDLSTWHDKF
ncbi:MAG: hypothetical protein WCV70_00015 [Patescibacteria group bacterium]|jgi:hypothetical protein